MIKASKFFEKTFTGENSKQVYLEACRWLAVNVINKNIELTDIIFNIKKISNKVPSFKIELYVELDEKEFMDGFCDRCQQMHRTFFINENCDCNNCKVRAYEKQINNKLSIKEQYRKEKLRYIFSKGVTEKEGE